MVEILSLRSCIKRLTPLVKKQAKEVRFTIVEAPTPKPRRIRMRAVNSDLRLRNVDETAATINRRIEALTFRLDQLRSTMMKKMSFT